MSGLVRSEYHCKDLIFIDAFCLVAMMSRFGHHVRNRPKRSTSDTNDHRSLALVKAKVEHDLNPGSSSGWPRENFYIPSPSDPVTRSISVQLREIDQNVKASRSIISYGSGRLR